MLATSETCRCPDCDAMVNPRWQECLACGARLAHPHLARDEVIGEKTKRQGPSASIADSRREGRLTDTATGTEDAWDEETAALITWFMRTPPPAHPFDLCRGVTVARPAVYWEAVRRDIAAGPGVVRANTGVLQNDLQRLAKLFGGPVRLRP